MPLLVLFNHMFDPGAEARPPYWRDVGTIDSYFTSNMELRARVPALDLYNRLWRIRTAQRDYPPARFVRAGEDYPPAHVDDSLICEGSIIVSAQLEEVVVGYDCFIHAGSHVRDSVNVMIEAGKTLLLVEQNVRFGLRLAKQGVVMESGRVLLTGEAESVLNNPEMSALYFGGTIEQSKDRKTTPVARA